MILGITIIGILLGIGAIFIKHKWGYIFNFDWETLGGCLIIFFSIFLAVMLLILAFVYIPLDATVATDRQEYDSLVYQIENKLYDNDNDLGKKELVNEVIHWNKNLQYHKKLERNFWVGIFFPNIYDKYEYIDLSLIK